MDHMNGIKMLYQNNQGCFNTVYLPNIFQAGNVALEFLILQHLADLKSKKSEPYQIWQLLHDLIKAQNCVQLIQRGTEFSGPSCQFKALWPIEDNPKITAQWNIAQATAVAAGFPLGEVSFIADKLRNAVKFLTSDTNAPASCKEAREETDASLERFRNLHMRYTELLNAKDRESRIIKKKLEELFDGLKENEHSIVFQTADDGSLQILMTGDTTTDSMRKIESNLVKPPVPIKDHYDIYKAPHHGTKNHYYATKFSYDRLLISNGETPKPKRGAISEQYLLNNNVKHIYIAQMQLEGDVSIWNNIIIAQIFA